MPSNSQVCTVGLSDVAPNVVILPPLTLNKSRNFAIATALRPPPTRDKPRNIAIAAAFRPPPTRDGSRNVTNTAAFRPITRDEKSVDLISVTSDDYPEDENDDQISFDEGRLQEWNLAEFQMQVLGALAGMVLIFGCGTLTAWAITDFVKDFKQNEATWTEVDYSFELLDKNHEDFWSSRHVIIAMVVLSYNVGCIVGAILGAFITPILPNRIIYLLGSMLMLLTSILLTMHTTAFFCARSRLMAGLVCGLVQVTLTVQAAESTTKKVRRWMLIVVAYVNALSSFVSSLIFYSYDGRDEITYTEANTALYITAYLMGGCAMAASVLNFLFTKDTIPFHLVRGEEVTAFEEISRLKSEHLAMLDIRCEYDRIRFDVTQSQLDANRNLAARSNHNPLISMCCARIMNLAYTSIPIILVMLSYFNVGFEYDSEDGVDVDPTPTPQPTSQEPSGHDDYPLNYALFVLATFQGFRLLCSIAVVIRKDKYYFNRTCYKLASLTGASLILLSIFYFISDFAILRYVVGVPMMIIVMVGFFGLPIPLDIIQLNQSADSYARIKNTWSLAFAIFVENFVHMLLIVQLDMMFGFYLADLLSGAILFFCSYWLLRNMPNIAAIHPCEIAIVAQATKRPSDGDTIHI